VPHPLEEHQVSQLHERLAALRLLISRSSTPQDIPDELRLSCFASRLLSLPLDERPTIATTALFTLFGDILALIPPPSLVDAICTTIDAAFRQPEQKSLFTVVVSERINSV
jgi:hypothetical protein